ncbi:MAG: hypothetical protein ACMXX6_01185 [Candidatus Woesearchaeota archaeon]
MKRGLLLIFLLIMPLASANVIHDSWHYYSDNFQKDGVIYDFLILENNFDTMRLSADNFTTIIRRGSCSRNLNYLYCYEEYNMDGEKIDISPKGILMPEVRLVIEREDVYDSSEAFNPTTSFSVNTWSSGDLFPGESGNFYLNISNDGDTAITNFRFRLFIPDNLRVVKQDLLQRTQGSLILSRDFRPGDSKFYNISFAPKDMGSVSLKYTYSYNSYEGYESSEGSSSFTIKEPYEFDFYLDKKELNLNDRVTATVKLSNLVKTDINVKRVRLFTGSRVSFVRTENLERVRVGEFTSGASFIPQNETSSFSATIEPLFSGEFKVSGFIDFEIDGVEFLKSFDESYDVVSDGLAQSFRSNRENVLPGQEIRLEYSLFNENENTVYNDLVVYFNSSFFNERVNFSQLRPGNSRKMLDETIKIPLDFESGEITAKAFYRAGLNQIESLPEAIINLDVISGDFFELEKEVDKEIVSPGDEILVSVRLKNLIDDNYQVLAEDFFGGLELITGRSEETVNVQAGQTRNVYTYRLKVPEDISQDSVLLTTNIRVPSFNIEKDFEKIISVEEYIKEDANEEVEDSSQEDSSSSNQEGSNQDDEWTHGPSGSKNWWQRFTSWLFG